MEHILVRCCIVLALLCGVSGDVAASILYSVTDLGTLGGTTSIANGINNLGQVTGWSTTSTGAREAFLYSDGRMTDLGSLGGSSTYLDNSIGFGVNDLGPVTGEALMPNGQYHAFLYNTDQMIDLGTLGGLRSYGNSINESGQIAGTALIDSPDIIGHAFLYSNGQMADLGTLGSRSSFAVGINNLGQVTGYAPTPGNQSHAFLYSGGQMIDLGTLGGAYSSSYAINNLGQVLGVSTTADGVQYAFLYSDGKMTALNDTGYLTSINDSGVMVGYSDVSYATLYSNGQTLDLNDLIDPALGITLWDADGINNQGKIIANGEGHAYLLTPIPEPGGVGSVAFGLLSLGIVALIRLARFKESKTYRDREVVRNRSKIWEWKGQFLCRG